MGKNKKRNTNEVTPKEEFPPLMVYLENPDERGYVRIPVEEAIGKYHRLCIIIGPRKTWETDIQALTEQLNIKRKDPIDFKDKGKCWSFYFDEDAGTLYNEPDDTTPILELCPAPKQEYINAKTEESSKPASIDNSQLSNSSVSSENKKQEKPIHNCTSGRKKEKSKETILPKKKGNEKAPKALPTVNKKPEVVAYSDTPNINEQPEDTADTPQKIEKALDEQQEVSPGELFRSGKEYEKKREFDKAIQAYRAAANAGFNQAGYKLGKLLMKLATDIFRQIAGLGHAGAQKELKKLGKGNPDSQTTEGTESLHDHGSKEKPKDGRETPSAPVKKETGRKSAGGTTEVTLSNSATSIGETAKPLHEQKAYIEAISNLIARYQLAKFRSEQASEQQNLDAENLLKKGSKESAECPHTISLALDYTTCNSSESCSGEDTPSNHTTVNFYDTVVNEPQVIIQEMVRHVTYWSGNDCLPELIIVAGSAPEACEFTRESGHEFSTECTTQQADFSSEPELSFMALLSLPFKKLFTIFRRWTDAEK